MRNINKLITLFVISILLLIFNGNKVYATTIDNSTLDNIEILGTGMLLMDYNSGTILAEKNANDPLAPASTTKIMTALLTLEKCDLNEIVKVNTNPCLAEGSSIGLKEGDEYTVEELLYALLLESANDSAVALAEHIAGTESDFAKLMNERAIELGTKNTHFVNASGLYEDNHYTTPYDLALIMKEFSKYKEFINICNNISYEMPVSIIDGQTKWVNNRNSLVNPNSKNYYSPIICSKTGYTTKSRHTYVAMAEKDNQRLILTLFDYDTKADYYEDTIKLFNYGFDNFKSIKLYNKGDIITEYKINEKNTIPLSVENDIYYVLSKKDFDNINDIEKLKTTLNTNLKIVSKSKVDEITHIEKNEKLFEGILPLKNKESYLTIPLLTETELSLTPENILFKTNYNNKFIPIIIFTTIITILLIFLLLINKRRKKSKYSNLFNKKNR
ncbi:MAG: serine hydrolase [Sarcina sp.]